MRMTGAIMTVCHSCLPSCLFSRVRRLSRIGACSAKPCPAAGRSFIHHERKHTMAMRRTLLSSLAACAATALLAPVAWAQGPAADYPSRPIRSEEHTSELQSPCNLVCRLLLEKKKYKRDHATKIRKTQIGLAKNTLIKLNSIN